MPTLIERLQAAHDLVVQSRPTSKDDGKRVIEALVSDHRASFTPGAQTNRLHCAGVASTCTWNGDLELLAGWLRLAKRRLARAGEAA